MKNPHYFKLKALIKNIFYNSKKSRPKLIERTPNLQELKIKKREEVILNKSLKQLEFINHLELNLKDEQLRFFSLSFLRDLEHTKFSAQRNTINLASTLRLDAA